MASKIKVDEIEEQSSGSNITLKNNVVIPTGKTLTITDGIAASKITTGTFADARISSSSVTQHTVTADLTPARHDIAMLALQSAVADNKAAFNLTNSFIDKFEDDTGIGTETSVDRQTDEYVASVYTGDMTHQAITGGDTGGGNIGGTATTNMASAITEAENDDSVSFMYTTNSSVSGYFMADLGASYTIAQIDLGKRRGHGDPTGIKLTYGTGSASSSSADNDVNLTNATNTVVTYTGSQPLLSNFTSSGTADWAAHSSNSESVLVRVTGFTPFSMRWLRFKFTSATFHDANAHWAGLKFYTQPEVNNATGTLIGVANVPSSAQTKVSGVALYKDNTGTATIGTDLKIYFTCNGGTNWTEAASYTAVTPVFSTGIKMLKLGETTCTSGSDVRYKVEWANQADGSKVTQLHGIGVNY